MSNVLKKMLVGSAVVVCMMSENSWGMHSTAPAENTTETKTGPTLVQNFTEKLKALEGYKSIYNSDLSFKEKSVRLSAKGLCKLQYTKNSAKIDVIPVEGSLIKKEESGFIVFDDSTKIATIKTNTAGNITVTLKGKTGFKGGEYHALSVSLLNSAATLYKKEDQCTFQAAPETGVDVYAFVRADEGEKPVAPGTKLEEWLGKIGVEVQAGENIDIGCTYEIDVALS